MLYSNMQQLSHDRREIASAVPRPGARRTKGGREAAPKKGSSNSNGGEEGRYAITNAYFRVIVRGAMKETTCNYHCCGCIGPHRAASLLFSFTSIPPSLPGGNANFCVLRKQGPLSTITSPRVLRHANRAYR